MGQAPVEVQVDLIRLVGVRANDKNEPGTYSIADLRQKARRRYHVDTRRQASCGQDREKYAESERNPVNGSTRYPREAIEPSRGALWNGLIHGDASGHNRFYPLFHGEIDIVHEIPR